MGLITTVDDVRHDNVSDEARVIILCQVITESSSFSTAGPSHGRLREDIMRLH